MRSPPRSYPSGAAYTRAICLPPFPREASDHVTPSRADVCNTSDFFSAPDAQTEICLHCHNRPAEHEIRQPRTPERSSSRNPSAKFAT